MDFETAKKHLSDLNKPGRVVRVNDNDWDVELLVDRAAQWSIEVNKRRELAKLKELERRNKEIEEKNMLEKASERSRLLIEHQIKLNDDIRQRQLKAKERSDLDQRDSIIAGSKRSIAAANLDEEKESKRHFDNVTSILLDRYGKHSEIIMQYRHAGSDSERGNEWGMWIVFKDSQYYAYHESIDRKEVAGKSNEVLFKSREDAINYATWHVSKDWYSDERFATKNICNTDFPKKNPPTEEERKTARMRFRSYKEIENENN